MNSHSQTSLFIIFFALVLSALATWPVSFSAKELQALPDPYSLTVPGRLVLGLKIPLHQATAQDLVHLPGLGIGKAQGVVDFLQSHGPITELDALLQISGIGPKTLAQIQPYLEL